MEDQTRHCRICQAVAQRRIAGLEGFRAGTSFDIYECAGCRCSFSDPQDADPGIYREIYLHSEILIGYDRYRAYYRAVKAQASPLAFLADLEDCYWFVADYLRRNVDAGKARLLEVGSGLGYLTYSLHRAGYDVRGVELSPVAVEDASKQFGALYRCRDALTLADEGERFDVVFLTEVVEHLADPASFLRRLAALLAPGGVILVTTPNKDYAPNRGSPWQTDLPPVHLWWFTKAAFLQMAETAGLSVSFHRFGPWHRGHFPRELRRTEKLSLPVPRLTREGAPIDLGRSVLRPSSAVKRLKSLVRYLWYRRRLDLDEGAILGAVFRAR